MSLRSYFGLLMIVIVGSMIIGCSGGKTPKGHFTADIVIGEGQKTVMGQFYSQGSRYRIAMKPGAINMVLIVDQTADQTFFVAPGQKSYRLLESNSPAIKRLDPFQAFKYAALEGTTRKEGTETIAGFECEKIVVSDGGKDLMIKWLAPGMAQPIKIAELEDVGDHYMELSNIEFIAVDDSLFEIPSNYEESILSASTSESETSFTTKTVVAPVKTPVKSGEELRVSVNPEDKIFIRFKSMAQQGESVCRVIFYENGREISSDVVGSVGYRTVTLKKLGASTKNTWEAPADEVALRILRGMMLLEVRKP
ncbi:MAG: hypothetical protein GY841_06590 [FCB group bacterium]|nr:hypothetical protein [FCB group bacterium]